MIDLTDRHTLMTIQAALRRALNSLDHEIAVVRYNVGQTHRTAQQAAKLALLQKDHADIEQRLQR